MEKDMSIDIESHHVSVKHLLEYSPKLNIYEVDFKIKRYRTRNHLFGWREGEVKDLIDDYIKFARIKEEWKIDEDYSEGVTKFAVSDAKTYIERLVFPAVWMLNTQTGERSLNWFLDQIEGESTFSIHGGDPSTVFPVQYYVGRMYALNLPPKDILNAPNTQAAIEQGEHNEEER